MSSGYPGDRKVSVSLWRRNRLAKVAFDGVRAKEEKPMKTVQRGVNRIIGNRSQLKRVARRPKFPLVEARNLNDPDILISTTGDDVQQLVREGAEVCGCDSAKLGVIQRVDVDPTSGSYVVLASLVGAPAVNQRVLTGNAHAGNDNEQMILRRPFLKLRKGTSYQAHGGETTTIRSLLLSGTTDRTGAGAKGLGQVINDDGEIAICIQFDNSAK